MAHFVTNFKAVLVKEKNQQYNQMVTDTQLVQKIMDGQQNAFQILIERYQEYVFTISFQVLKVREEAEEAAQDTFLKVYKLLKQFEGKSKFSTWLYTIAYRTAIDYSRKKKKVVQSIDENPGLFQLEDTQSAGPMAKTQQGNIREVLQQIIGQLPPQDANILSLYYLHEQSVKEIAIITGLSLSNVKVKLYRIREQLKQLLTKALKAEIQDWI